MKIYEDHNLKENKVPAIFHNVRPRYIADRTIIGNAVNWHENIEILHIYNGSGIITIDEEHIYVNLGDIVIINSNCIHYCIATSEHFSYHCLIIDRQFCISNGFDSNAIKFESSFKDDRIGVLMTSLAMLWKAPDPPEFKELKIKSMLLQIMEHICFDHRVLNTYPVNINDSNKLTTVKLAIEFINKFYGQDISLTDVAEHVGTSQYYLAHIFKNITGNTFLAYLTRVRCEAAKKMLANTTLAISEISGKCGFQTPSYFAKKFKALYNILPHEYRSQTISKRITLS